MTTIENEIVAQTLGRKPTDEEIDFFGLTHQGKVRKDNQDHFFLGSVPGGTSPRSSLPNDLEDVVLVVHVGDHAATRWRAVDHQWSAKNGIDLLDLRARRPVVDQCYQDSLAHDPGHDRAGQARLPSLLVIGESAEVHLGRRRRRRRIRRAASSELAPSRTRLR